jgi:hypothetical protein
MIEFMSALTVVPSSAASFLIERANDSWSLIVLRTDLRSSLLEFGKEWPLIEGTIPDTYALFVVALAICDLLAFSYTQSYRVSAV